MCKECDSMYEKVSTDLNFVEREKEVIEFWKKKCTVYRTCLFI